MKINKVYFYIKEGNFPYYVEIFHKIGKSGGIYSSGILFKDLKQRNKNIKKLKNLKINNL